jgi:hypothetical protein
MGVEELARGVQMHPIGAQCAHELGGLGNQRRHPGLLGGRNEGPGGRGFDGRPSGGHDQATGNIGNLGGRRQVFNGCRGGLDHETNAAVRLEVRHGSPLGAPRKTFEFEPIKLHLGGKETGGVMGQKCWGTRVL